MIFGQAMGKGFLDGAAKRAKNLAALATQTRAKPPFAGGGATPSDVVHAENKWKLLRYRRPDDAPPKYATPVLLVPSLINRHYVLDLMPGKSFAEYLVEQGHDVFMIDWGRPGPEDRFLSFDDVCDRYLGRAVRKAAGMSRRNKVHLFGYCLGGTLGTIHAAARPEHIASLVNIAAPVAFHDDGQLSAWTRSSTFDIDAMLKAFGNVPAWLMQAAFHMLRPTLNLAKLVYLLEKAGDDDFLDSFLALETWANDNVDFPGGVFKTYIRELYREDRLIKGTFRLSDRAARLDKITAPILCITFEHDNIVPAKSASALVDVVASPDKELLHLPGGHVGSVVSRGAKKHLWPKISGWMAERDHDRDPIVDESQPRMRDRAAPQKTNGKRAPRQPIAPASAKAG